MKKFLHLILISTALIYVGTSNKENVKDVVKAEPVDIVYDADEIPLNETVQGVAAYLNTSKTVIDSSKAPTGATNKVLKLDGTTEGVGTIFDFKDAFSVNNVVSITFRFYTDSKYEARVTTCAGQGSKGWLMRYDIASLSNQWVNVTLNKDGTNFYTGTSMSDFADGEGYFKPFNFMMRSGTTLYIDSVTFNVDKKDNVAPIIHTDITQITTHVGVRPQLNVSATDNIDGEVPITYKWSENALDKKGKLTQGTHTCTLIAKDSSNNKTTHNITFTVNA